MIKKIFTALYADENIPYFNEDSGDVVFNSNGTGVLNVDLHNIILYNNFDVDDPDTVTSVILMAWHIKFEKRKELKKKISEELTPVAWHHNRWWNFSVPEDAKKEREPIFTEWFKCIQFENIATDISNIAIDT